MHRCIPIFLVLLSASALANDGSGHMAAGGSISLIKGNHPTIRLVDEKLHIKLPEGTVRVEYVFRNEGPATKTLMAFPEEGYMLDPKDKKKVAQREGTLFGYFRSWVDGKRMAVTRRQGEGGAEVEEGGGYNHWWVKEVPFGKNETRRVVNEYQGGLGWGPPWAADRSFSYTLHTGGTWKGGTIGNLEVTIDARGLAGVAPLQLGAFGKETGKTPGIWTMSKKDFKPTDDLYVRWFNGFGKFIVNGRKFPDGFYTLSPYPPMKVTPIKIGRDAFIPAPLLPGLLGVTVKKVSGGMTLTRGEKTLNVDSRWKGTFSRHGRTMLSARAVVTAFGGKLWWSDGTVFVSL